MQLAENMFKKVVSRRRHVFLLYLLFLILIFGVLLKGDFVFDDTIFVVANQDITSLSNIGTFFITSPVSGTGLESNFYRPLQTLFYALIHSVFGLNPSIYHSVPLLFHLGTTFLLYLFFIRLGFKKTTSFLAGALFLIHPAQTEAVSYISGLADPLALFFTLSALLLVDKRKYLFIPFFIIALFSKEWAVIFPALVLILHMYRYMENKDGWSWKFPIISTAISGVGSLLYLIAKFTILDFTGAGGLATQAPELGVRITTFISILYKYLVVIFWPVHLYIERPYEFYATLLSWKGILGLCILSAGIGGVVLSWYRKKYRVIFAILWIGIALLPYTNFIPLNAIYLEHWLYVPMVGVCILIASLIEHIPHTKTVTAIFVALLLLLSARSIMRNNEWADPELFYLNEIQYNETARIHNNLAMYYAENNDPKRALSHYEQSLRINSSFPQTYHNIANTYRDLGEYATAEMFYKKALEIQPSFYHSRSALYLLYLDMGQKEKANQLIQE